jgi:hypothetical protein
MLSTPEPHERHTRWVEIRICGAIPHWGGGKVPILYINVTIRDSGWRLTVQEVLLNYMLRGPMALLILHGALVRYTISRIINIISDSSRSEAKGKSGFPRVYRGVSCRLGQRRPISESATNSSVHPLVRELLRRKITDIFSNFPPDRPLPTTNVLALATMKNAAKCDT